MLWISITSSFLASGLVSGQTESRLKERKVTLADWLRQALIPLLLLIPHYVVLFWLVFSVPNEFTTRVWIYVGIALLVIAFYVVGGGLIVSRWLGLARRVPERVARIVEVAAQRVGVRPKAAYVLRWKAANALAFPISQAIAFSDTAVKHLDDDELIAICVHELGHLDESRRVKRLRILGNVHVVSCRSRKTNPGHIRHPWTGGSCLVYSLRLSGCAPALSCDGGKSGCTQFRP